MRFRLRPRLGRLVSNRFLRVVTTLATAALVACGSSAETSFLQDDGYSGEPTSGSVAPESRPSCAPNIGGLVPAGIEPTEIACPRGYARRRSFAAMPIAGRFTTQQELTDAYCIETEGTSAPATDPRRPIAEASIDFTRNDVVAYAFDVRAGAPPALFEHGDDLWLKVTTNECGGEAPTLASLAFIVPKGKSISEQKCSQTCE